MKLAALISGGKDSLYALYTMSKKHEIAYLLTVFPERDDSYMFHHPNLSLTKLQAEAMGIPLLTRVTKGEKEKELEDLKRLFSKVKDRVDGIVSGALASRYQKQRIDKLCEELGLKSLAPLWGISGEELWKQLLENKFEVIVTSVAAMGLSKEWLGRKIDHEAFEELKKMFNAQALITFELGYPFNYRKIFSAYVAKGLCFLDLNNSSIKSRLSLCKQYLTSNPYMVAKLNTIVKPALKPCIGFLYSWR